MINSDSIKTMIAINKNLRYSCTI